MDCQIVLAGGFNQYITTELKIGRSGKDDLTIVAALNDVLWLAWDDVAGKARQVIFLSTGNHALSPA